MIAFCAFLCVKPKQFTVKAPKGLRGREVYEIDYNLKGIPKDIIPVVHSRNQLALQSSISRIRWCIVCNDSTLVQYT